MILENDVDGRGKENDDEMRNVMKTTKRGGRSSKRGGKAPSTDAAVEEEEVFEEEEEEEIMVVEKEDVFIKILIDNDLSMMGTNLSARYRETKIDKLHRSPRTGYQSTLIPNSHESTRGVQLR